MSQYIRRSLYLYLNRLNGYRARCQPILEEAENGHEPDVVDLRELRVCRTHMQEVIPKIEEKEAEWTTYIGTLPVMPQNEDGLGPRAAEELVYDDYVMPGGQLHFTEFVDQSREKVTQIDIILDDAASNRSMSSRSSRSSRSQRDRRQQPPVVPVIPENAVVLNDPVVPENPIAPINPVVPDAVAQQAALVQAFRDAVREVAEVVREAAPAQVAGGVAGGAAGGRALNAPRLHKLPPVEFNGNPLHWQSFWQKFQSSVDRQNLADCDKMSYLIASLKGVAARAVRDYPVTDENYTVIIDILKKRFGDPGILEDALIAEMVSLPRAMDSPTSLRETAEAMDRICKQLTQLGKSEEPMLFHARKKISAEVYDKLVDLEEAWEERPENQGQEWKMNHFRTALQKYIAKKEKVTRQNGTAKSSTKLQEEAIRQQTLVKQQVLVKSSSEQSGDEYESADESTRDYRVYRRRNRRRNRRSRMPLGRKPEKDREQEQSGDEPEDVEKEPNDPTPSNVQAFSAMARLERNYGAKNHHQAHAPRQCIFCGGSHRMTDCDKIVQVNDRKSKLVELKRCFACICQGHQAIECRRRAKCRSCAGEHHQILCPNLNQDKLKRVDGGSAMINRKRQGRKRFGERPRKVSVAGDRRPRILRMRSNYPTFLMMKRVQIADSSLDALSLWDTGCPISFVKRTFAERIGAPVIGREILLIYPLGSQKPTRLNATRHLIKLKKPDGGTEELEAYAIEHIGSVCPWVTITGSRWNPSAVVRGSEDEPEVLLGVFDFWRFFLGKEEAVRDAVVIHTTLGDVLCGRWQVDARAREGKHPACNQTKIVPAFSAVLQSPLELDNGPIPTFVTPAENFFGGDGNRIVAVMDSTNHPINGRQADRCTSLSDPADVTRGGPGSIDGVRDSDVANVARSHPASAVVTRSGSSPAGATRSRSSRTDVTRSYLEPTEANRSGPKPTPKLDESNFILATFPQYHHKCVSRTMLRLHGGSRHQFKCAGDYDPNSRWRIRQTKRASNSDAYNKRRPRRIVRRYSTESRLRSRLARRHCCSGYVQNPRVVMGQPCQIEEEPECQRIRLRIYPKSLSGDSILCASSFERAFKESARGFTLRTLAPWLNQVSCNQKRAPLGPSPEIHARDNRFARRRIPRKSGFPKNKHYRHRRRANVRIRCLCLTYRQPPRRDRRRYCAISRERPRRGKGSRRADHRRFRHRRRDNQKDAPSSWRKFFLPGEGCYRYQKQRNGRESSMPYARTLNEAMRKCRMGLNTQSNAAVQLPDATRRQPRRERKLYSGHRQFGRRRSGRSAHKTSAPKRWRQIGIKEMTAPKRRRRNWSSKTGSPSQSDPVPSQFRTLEHTPGKHRTSEPIPDPLGSIPDLVRKIPDIWNSGPPAPDILVQSYMLTNLIPDNTVPEKSTQILNPVEPVPGQLRTSGHMPAQDRSDVKEEPRGSRARVGSVAALSDDSEKDVF